MISKLFARNSKGEVKVWIIEVSSEDSKGVIKISYGELRTGNLQPKIEYIHVGKNLGKSNETTPYEQAILEAKSRVTLQKKLGYKDSDDLNLNPEECTRETLERILPIDNVDQNENIIPMKCQKYFKITKKKGVETQVVRLNKYPLIGQPKLNGVRAFMKYDLIEDKVKLFSKKGLEYTILNHITEEIDKESFDYEGKEIIFDGELYVSNTILSDITSAVRTPQLLTGSVHFYCFDLALPDLDQNERDEIRKTILSPFLKNIINVRNNFIRNEAQADEFFEWTLREGYEGAIFRDPTAYYGFGKRPQTITKRKKYIEEEFLIVDVLPMEKDPLLGMFLCKHKDNTFTVVPEGNRVLKALYLSNKQDYIGKKLTVQFYEWTVNDKPFHAKGIAVRDYE